MKTKSYRIPGPWQVLRGPAFPDLLIAPVDLGEDDIVAAIYPCAGFKRTLANAVLVAAAPDLLDALKETYAALTKANTAHCGREYALASNAARAAIAKAEGR